MGSAGDFLFGSTEDAKYLGNVDTLLPGQKNNLIALNNLLSGQMGLGVEPYQGQTAPGTSPLQQQAFDLVTQLIQGEGSFGAGQDALDGLLADFDPASSTEYWESAVRDPMVDTWEDDILPQVQEHFISRNAGSSGAANRAVAQSGADLAADLSSTLAQTLYAAEQGHLDRQSQAIPQALDYSQGAIDQSLQAGGVQRDITGDQLLELLQKWTYEQPYNNPWLSGYSSLAMNTQAFQPVVQGPTQQPGALDSISRLLSVLL